jgi:hypothetical protein
MKLYFNLLFILSINIYCSSFLSKLKGIFKNISPVIEQIKNNQKNIQNNFFQQEPKKLPIFNQIIFNKYYQIKNNFKKNVTEISNSKNKQELFKKNATKIRNEFKFFIQKSKYYPPIKSLIKKNLKSDTSIDKELIETFGEEFFYKEDIKNKLIKSILLEKNYDTKYKKLKKKLGIISFLLINLYLLLKIKLLENENKKEEIETLESLLKEQEKPRYENLTIFLSFLYKYYNMKLGEIGFIETFSHELGHAIENITAENFEFYNLNDEFELIKDDCNKTIKDIFDDISFDDFFKDYKELEVYNLLIDIILLNKNIDKNKDCYFITINKDIANTKKIHLSGGGSFCGAWRTKFFDKINTALSGGTIGKIIGGYYNDEEIIKLMGGDIKNILLILKKCFIEEVENKNLNFFDALKKEKDNELVKNIIEAQEKAEELEKDEFLFLLKKDIVSKLLNEALKTTVEEKEKISEYFGNFIAYMMQQQIKKYKKYEIPIKEMAMKYGPAAIPGNVYFNGIDMTREFIESCKRNNIPIAVSKNLEKSYKFINQMNENLIKSRLSNQDFIDSIEESIRISPILNSFQKKYLEITGKNIQNLSKRAPSYNDFNSYQHRINYLIANGQNFYSSNAFQNNKYKINKNFRHPLFDQIKIHNPFLNNKILSK